MFERFYAQSGVTSAMLIEELEDTLKDVNGRRERDRLRVQVLSQIQKYREALTSAGTCVADHDWQHTPLKPEETGAVLSTIDFIRVASNGI